MTIDPGNVVALIVSMLALGGTALSLWANRRKTRAEAVSMDAQAVADLQQAATNIVAPLNMTIAGLKSDLSNMRNELAGVKVQVAEGLRREGEYLIGISQLTEQLVKANLDPVWRPPMRKPGTGPITPKTDDD